MPNSDPETKKGHRLPEPKGPPPRPPRPQPSHESEKPAGKLPEVAPAGRYLAPMSFAPSINTLAL